MENDAKDFRVRLAGWRNNEPIPINEDVRLFQKLEDPFVHWRDRLEANAEDPAHLTPAQWQAIWDFRNKGGHVSRLSPERIRLIMRTGIMIFLERKIGEDIFAAFGSVCALSAAPYTADCLDDQSEPDWQADYRLDPTWPNVDLRDLVIPMHDYFRTAAGRMMHICRSSIRSTLSPDLLSDQDRGTLGDDAEKACSSIDLRRKGYATRGKLEVLTAGHLMGNEMMGMNIGILHSREDAKKTVSIGHTERRKNQPSALHNLWCDVFGWRLRYNNVIIPDNTTMYWVGHIETMTRALMHLHKQYQRHSQESPDTAFAKSSPWS